MKALLKVTSCVTAISFSMCVSASIVSGVTTTDAGAVVNLSGLEWMSFDHQEGGNDYTSLNVLWDTYDDVGTIWDLNGWRLATESEVTALYSSLSLINGEVASNADGVAFLHDNFGFEAVAASSFYGPDYGFGYSINYGAYNWLNGVFLSDTAGMYGSLRTKSGFSNEYIDHNPSDAIDYTQYSSDHEPASQFVQADFNVSLSDRGDQWGAFFVRESTVSEVPVPPAFLLMVSGLATVFGLARKKKYTATVFH